MRHDNAPALELLRVFEASAPAELHRRRPRAGYVAAGGEPADPAPGTCPGVRLFERRHRALALSAGAVPRPCAAGPGVRARRLPRDRRTMARGAHHHLDFAFGILLADAAPDPFLPAAAAHRREPDHQQPRVCWMRGPMSTWRSSVPTLRRLGADARSCCMRRCSGVRGPLGGRVPQGWLVAAARAAAG